VAGALDRIDAFFLRRFRVARRKATWLTKK
jgi:hypothetical protein